MRCACWLTLVVAAAVAVAPPAARGEFRLTDTDRVLTYGGRAADRESFSFQVETYVRLRYPQRRTWFMVEQAAPDGTVSSGLAQFDERVKPWDPTVVLLCFGIDDAGGRAFDPARLEAFDAGLRQLIARCRAIGADVFLLTPLCPDTDRLEELRDIQYDQCVGRYAAAVRTIGQELTVPVIDWYQASVDYRAASGNAPRLRLTTNTGVDPTPLGAALATDGILTTWQAEPHRFVIRADWNGAKVEVSSGRISATRRDEETLVLSLKDIPLAWYIPNRGALLASDWPPSHFYEYILQIDNIPDEGFVVGEYVDGQVTRGKPFLGRQMLREGWDVSGIGPLAQPQATQDLYEAMAERDAWYRRVEEFKRRPVPDPEFKMAYETQALAFRQYADGTARIVLRMPRTTSIDIGIQTAKAAAADARRARAGEATPATTQPGGADD